MNKTLNITKSLNFLRLDLLLLKKLSVAFLILFVAALFIGPLGYLLVMVLISPYPFLSAEKNKLNVLYATLPCNRKHVVIGRYMFAFLSVIMATVISFIGSLLLPLISSSPIAMSEIVLTLCLLSSLFLILISFQYPIHFKMNYSKSRIISLIPVVIFIAATMIVLGVANGVFGKGIGLSQMFGFLSENIAVTCSVSLAIAAIAFGASLVVSCKLYEKKDI